MIKEQKLELAYAHGFLKRPEEEDIELTEDEEAYTNKRVDYRSYARVVRREARKKAREVVRASTTTEGLAEAAELAYWQTVTGAYNFNKKETNFKHKVQDKEKQND